MVSNILEVGRVATHPAHGVARLTCPDPLSIVGPMWDPGRWAGVRRLLFGWAVLLLILLGRVTSAVADHPAGKPASPGALDTAAPGTLLGLLDSALSVQWGWALLAMGLTIAAACALRPPRRLAGALTLLVAVFACETALHSAHHVNEPTQAERCPVSAASLHVAGLEAGLATPELPLPMPISHRLQARDAPRPAWVLDASSARAPPALLA